MTGWPPYDSGRATVAELAAAEGKAAPQTLRTLADLSAAGAIRIVIGTEPIPDLPVAGHLLLADDDEGEFVVLFLVPPGAPPLDDLRKRHLEEGLKTAGDALTLALVMIMCAGIRVAGDDYTFTSDDLEDFLGAKRGSLRDNGGQL